MACVSALAEYYSGQSLTIEVSNHPCSLLLPVSLASRGYQKFIAGNFINEPITDAGSFSVCGIWRNAPNSR